MAVDDRLDRRKIDLVVFSRHRAGRVIAKWKATMPAMCRAMIFDHIRRLDQTPRVPLVTRSGSAGT